MEKMRAVIFKQHGDVSKLEYTYVPSPKIGPHEVLVRVKSCAVNHLDLWTLAGMPGMKIPLPHILGCDIAGEVVETGAKAKNIVKHVPVVISPGLVANPGQYKPLGYWDSLTDHYRIIGFQVDGGYAEYVKVPKQNVIPVSPRFSYEEWASVPLVFMTAYHMLVTRANLQKGEKVLIHAAGSGVGSAAIQIAKYFEAEVFTTVGSDDKIKKAKALGADHVIPYHKKDFHAEIMHMTDGKGVEVVVEHIGPATFAKSVACLAKRGRLVTCGVTSGPTVNLDLRFIFARQLSLMGCYMGGIKELHRVIHLVKHKRLKPVVDKIYPLGDAKLALERMKSRAHFGKIVLTNA